MNKIKWLLILILGVSALGRAITVDELLQKENRPELYETASVPLDQMTKRFGELTPTAEVKRLFKVYEEMIQALIPRLANRIIYCLARDAEEFCESFHVFLNADPRGKLLQSRIRTIMLTRPMLSNSSSSQILSWLETHHLDLEKAKQGSQIYLFLDTGYNGSIPGALVKLLPQGIEPLLMASAGTYPEVLSTNQARQQAGLPTDKTERWKYVYQAIELGAPKWRGRGARLSPDGNSIISYQSGNDEAVPLDKNRVLKRHAQIIAYFSKPTLWEAMGPAVEKVIQSLGIEAAPTAYEAPPLVPVPLLAGVPSSALPIQPIGLAPGTEFKAANGKHYTVDLLIKASSSGVLFRVISKEDPKKKFAFKIAIDNSPDALESIRNEINRLEAVSKLTLPHSTVIATGPNYLLKEWVEGQDGKAWLKEFSKGGEGAGANEILSWRSLMTLSRGRGSYVRNLRPSNLVWDKKQWVIIDPGPVKSNLPDSEVVSRYKTNLQQRWADKLPPSCADRLINGIFN